MSVLKSDSLTISSNIEARKDHYFALSGPLVSEILYLHIDKLTFHHFKYPKLLIIAFLMIP